MRRECETCIKKKTMYCPSSMECMETDDMLHYQNRIMLLEENDSLKNQQKEFIKYLEDEIKKIEKVQVSSLEEITGKDYIIKLKREILAKYKEIIGDVENEKI